MLHRLAVLCLMCAKLIQDSYSFTHTSDMGSEAQRSGTTTWSHMASRWTLDFTSWSIALQSSGLIPVGSEASTDLRNGFLGKDAVSCLRGSG